MITIRPLLMLVLCYEGFMVSIGWLSCVNSLCDATVFRGIRVTPQWVENSSLLTYQ